MRGLFYDKETTGMPLWKEPSEDPRQPHIVQLAAKLVDLPTRRIIHAMNVIIQPQGWEVPQEVTDIHGITHAYAQEIGISEETAMNLFLQMWESANVRIAHNESFDARIVRIALKRYPDLGVDADVWKVSPAQCTADMATGVMNMAPTARMVRAGRNYAKKPKLSEAYQHFAGKPLENAHSAEADVDACMFIYYAMNGLDALPSLLECAPVEVPEPSAPVSTAPAPAAAPAQKKRTMPDADVNF